MLRVQFVGKSFRCPYDATTTHDQCKAYIFASPDCYHFKCFSTRCAEREPIFVGERKTLEEQPSIDYTDKIFDIENAVPVRQKYISMKWEDQYAGKVVAISSNLGTGKTEVIRQWVDSHKHRNVLYVSYRRLLSMDIC